VSFRWTPTPHGGDGRGPPMTLEASVHAFRLRVIARGQALGNVSQACREFGISRTLFCRWRRRNLAYGSDGLYPKRPGPRRGRPPTPSVEAERAILAVALAVPTWGPARVSAHLALAPATIYRSLRRVGLQTRTQRLGVLEVCSAQTAGLLTERTRRTLAQARRRQSQHVVDEQPGDQVCLDTFYVGKLKGLGRSGSTPPAMRPARSPSPKSPPSSRPKRRSASSPHGCSPPTRQPAGLTGLLTDCGSEYRGAFDQACVARGIRHTRTRPRHTWTNGLSNACRAPSLASFGAWSSAAGSSSACSPCRPRWIGTSSSTTTAGPTWATAPAAARLPSCSGESRGGRIMTRLQNP
jgi:hypothetical protein